MRTYIIIASILVGMGLIAGIYRAGASSEKAKQLQEITDTKERINEAISDGVGVGWRDRLHEAQ